MKLPSQIIGEEKSPTGYFSSANEVSNTGNVPHPIEFLAKINFKTMNAHKN